jgi:putative oxidoreductase
MLSVLRIVAGLIFLPHGLQKLVGFPATDFMPPVGSLLWVGGVIEVVAGVLLILGLFTRPVAFLASGTMAVAYWMFHAPSNMIPTLNGGDAAILYCFVFLYFVFAGGGVWSLDAVRGETRSAARA